MFICPVSRGAKQVVAYLHGLIQCLNIIVVSGWGGGGVLKGDQSQNGRLVIFVYVQWTMVCVYSRPVSGNWRLHLYIPQYYQGKSVELH